VVRTRLLIICICILAAALTSHTVSASSRSLNFAQSSTYYTFISPSAPTPTATIAVQPNATKDPNRIMSQITVELALNNTPDVPPFNNVQVLLSYDSRVLTAASLDYSTNVFTQTSFTQVLVRDCLDGHAANNGSPGLCGGDDGPGYVSFAESILGGATPDGTQGNIFFLTFNVNTAT